jgi:pimeloyl-ACP methyl ester carboxylesterase
MSERPFDTTARFTWEGMTLVAETHGAGAAPTTFVLLHGIGMGRAVFADLQRLLSADARVVAVDLPGYGEAPEPDPIPTMEAMADLVAAYIDHLDRGPVVLVGHSMGTQIAVEVAVRHPSTVNHLVIVAPTVDRRHRRALSQLWRLGVDLLDESPRVLLVGAREYLRAGPNLRRKLRAMLVHRPEDVYPRVSVPTLVVRGGTDRVCPPRWCAEVVAALPDAEVAEIAGHGHETLIRNGAPAARAIAQFLHAQRSV